MHGPSNCVIAEDLSERESFQVLETLRDQCLASKQADFISIENNTQW